MPGKMPGKHKFPPAPKDYIILCEHCGETTTDLYLRRVGGKLPPCHEASDDASQPGKC